MTVHLMARRAYARPDVTARNPRAVEYDLLAKCTSDLNAAWHRRDTEFATETANLTKQNILQQAASTILSQANQRPQSALSLLQG